VGQVHYPHISGPQQRPGFPATRRGAQQAVHHPVAPVGHITGVFVKIHEELAERVATAGSDKGFQGRRIREVIQDLPSHFTMSDIVEELSKAAHSTIQRILKELKESREIETVGAGPKAYYRKLSVKDR
jgi:hypothetical protein